MTPRKPLLRLHRNFGIPPKPAIDDGDQPPILMIWIMASLCGGFMGFIIGLTIGMWLR